MQGDDAELMAWQSAVEDAVRFLAFILRPATGVRDGGCDISALPGGGPFATHSLALRPVTART
jgi:hypothetical protein